ncbi:MAG: hypothetical protein Q8O37_05380 [Sulfuricellaceae bacterium]|nr:hypothetical protein [Sulfuricellaceae bacterium]
MRDYLKNNWRLLAGNLALVLLALGGAFFWVHSASKANQAEIDTVKEEMDDIKSSSGKAQLELVKLKGAYEKEKTVAAELQKKSAAAGDEIAALKRSLAEATEAAKKIPPPLQCPKPKTIAAAPLNCPKIDDEPRQAQLRALQNLQSDIYRRENELREKQRKLDETQKQIAAERHKLGLEKNEYRWPREPVKTETVSPKAD